MRGRVTPWRTPLDAAGDDHAGLTRRRPRDDAVGARPAVARAGHVLHGGGALSASAAQGLPPSLHAGAESASATRRTARMAVATTRAMCGASMRVTSSL